MRLLVTNIILNLDSNFRRVLNVVRFLFCFVLFVCGVGGDSPASEFYVPTVQNTLSVPSSTPMKTE